MWLPPLPSCKNQSRSPAIIILASWSVTRSRSVESSSLLSWSSDLFCVFHRNLFHNCLDPMSTLIITLKTTVYAWKHFVTSAVLNFQYDVISLSALFGTSKSECVKPQWAEQFRRISLHTLRQQWALNCTTCKTSILALTSFSGEDDVSRFSWIASRMWFTRFVLHKF
jgi:hypothetical protein